MLDAAGINKPEAKRFQKALASAAAALTAGEDGNCTVSSSAADASSVAAAESEAENDPVWEVGWSSISECVQEGGDVIYIPSGWNHAVLNTQVRTCCLLLHGATCCLLLGVCVFADCLLCVLTAWVLLTAFHEPTCQLANLLALTCNHVMCRRVSV